MGAPAEDAGWEDEWAAEDWQELTAFERADNGRLDWVNWTARLAVIALLLPIVLGVLATLLILAF